MTEVEQRHVDPLYAEKELTDQELLLRKLFVDRFMLHRDPCRACLEIGISDEYAEDFAEAFLAEGAVRRLIAQADDVESTKDVRATRQNKYRAWMENEATYYGPGASHGARVTAISNLMKIEGMDSPVDKDTGGVKGGVMIVPAMVSPDEWGELAAKSQAVLKGDVK